MVTIENLGTITKRKRIRRVRAPKPVIIATIGMALFILTVPVFLNDSGSAAGVPADEVGFASTYQINYLNSTYLYLKESSGKFTVEKTGTLGVGGVVAEYSPSTGTLKLQNYNWGQIFISEDTNPRDLIIDLYGSNTITYKGTRGHGGVVNLSHGGSTTITSSTGGSLSIEVEEYLGVGYGITNNVDGISYGHIFIRGNADVKVKVNSTKFVAFGLCGKDINVLENASLDVFSSTNSTTTAYALDTGDVGKVNINTTGKVTLEQKSSDKTSFTISAHGSITLTNVNQMTLKWTGGKPTNKAIIFDQEKFDYVKAENVEAYTPKYAINVMTPTIAEGGTHNFAGTLQGYTQITPTNFTIQNIGPEAMTDLDIKLTGTDAGSFILEKTSPWGSTIAPGNTTNFTIGPKEGLTAKTHSATVEISDTKLIMSYFFNIIFTVNAVTPAAPGDLTASPGAKKVVLAWTAPNDGGSPITGYEVSYGPVSGYSAKWDMISWSDALTASYTVNGLTDGTEYKFEVRAVNAIGSGASSDTTATPATPATPATTPSAPGDLTASPGAKKVVLAWTTPSDGGSPITGYEVSYGPVSGYSAKWDMISGSDALTASYTVNGLTDGTEYKFEVRAVNAIGSGASSDTTATPFTPVTAPSAPGDLTASPGAKKVVLAWTAPNDSGRPITGYEVS
jgi:hypothetical protein